MFKSKSDDYNCMLRNQDLTAARDIVLQLANEFIYRTQVVADAKQKQKIQQQRLAARKSQFVQALKKALRLKALRLAFVGCWKRLATKYEHKESVFQVHEMLVGSFGLALASLLVCSNFELFLSWWYFVVGQILRIITGLAFIIVFRIKLKVLNL